MLITIIKIIMLMTTLALASLAASASAAIALCSWTGSRASLLEMIMGMMIRLMTMMMMTNMMISPNFEFGQNTSESKHSLPCKDIDRC